MVINWWCFVLFFTFVWMLTSLYRVLFCTQTFTCNFFIFFSFFFSLLWISGMFALVLVDALFGKKINIDDGMHCKMYQREIHVHFFFLFKNKTEHSCFGPFHCNIWWFPPVKRNNVTTAKKWFHPPKWWILTITSTDKKPKYSVILV